MNNILKGRAPKRKAGSRKLPAIWIIPILAVLIGIGMIYRHYQTQGHDIQVVFNSADGLVAKQTKVKYRNIDIGTVKSVTFSDDLKKVIAGIEVTKNMGLLLREDTSFWVVKPRVGSGGVSGLSTILSGSYIELSPGKSQNAESNFIGLEEPPILRDDDNGLRLKLTSKDGMRLHQGQPILYRGFKVGEIDKKEFNPDTRVVNYDIFIRQPYDSLVTTNTFFWNKSGLSVNATAKGISLDMGSLETMLSGGIQFDVPADLSLGNPVTQTRSFRLYESEQSVYENRKYASVTYLILVKDSVAGLEVGSPVEYRGIRLGTVVSPHLSYSQETKIGLNPSKDDRIAVLVRIEPERLFGKNGISLSAFKPEFDKMLRQGLTATIQSSNFILGSKIVSLDFAKQPKKIKTIGKYRVIPYQSGSVKQITDKVDNILTKMESLPLQATSNNVNRAVNHAAETFKNANLSVERADQAVESASNVMVTADKTLNSLNESVTELTALLKQKDTQSMTREINQTLKEMQVTLKGLQEDAPAYQGANESMHKLQQTLDDMQPILRNVSNDPNALVFGENKPADSQPPAELTK